MSPFKPVVKSMFSASHIFLFILLAFLALFVVSNVSTVMTSLGFQTKEAVKAELVQTKAQLKEVTEVNEQNAIALDIERAANQQMREQIAKVAEEVIVVERVVNVIKVKKVKRDAPVIQRVVEQTVVTETTLTLPKAEINLLSASNIEQVHEVFSALFPDVPPVPV